MLSLTMPGLKLENTVADLQEQRFSKILRIVLLAVIVVSFIIPFLPVFDVQREKRETIPPRFAKVLMEKKQAPKPPPPLAQPKPEPEIVQKEEVQPEKPKELPKKEAPKVENKKSVQEKVAKVGLLALRSELASLHDDAMINRITNPNQKLVSGAKTEAKARTKPQIKDVNNGSGGIDTSKLSRRTTETQLEKRSLTQVKTEMLANGDQKRDGEVFRNVRPIEELRLVIERHKGSFNTLYNRELRKNPGLQGKVLFELIIAPSGEVTSVKILQSELRNPALEKKFLVKWKSIDFGPKDVEETIISYPLDFFPA